MISSIVPATSVVVKSGLGDPKTARFFKDARALLEQADDIAMRGDSNTAFEYYYRAALRIGAAWIAFSPIAKRKRKPQGVWEQMKLVGADAAQWAAEFQALALERRRAATFARYRVGAEQLETMRDLVQRFFSEVQQRTAGVDEFEVGLASAA